MKFDGSELKINLKRAGEVLFAGTKLNWRMMAGKSLSRFATRREFFDADKVGNEIVLRHWRVGDRFQPIGLKSPVKLQDLFTNTKIPRERRHELIMATTVRDEIFWVEGLRISEKFKIAPQTKQQLIWNWRKVAG
jgi:tRNA(Ile)-lysidine synthetase-like protein